MLSMTIAIAIAVVLWTLREAFYAKANQFKNAVDLSVKDSEVNTQDDFKELIDKINEKKSENNGKWYSMKDVDHAMATTSTSSNS